jgi:gamma-glutamyltranspeptidase/glutathione hydrolase
MAQDAGWSNKERSAAGRVGPAVLRGLLLGCAAVSELVPSVTVRAEHGAVCAVDHLAAQAGLTMLRSGGSAVDAAVATSAVLAVTTPHMCGMGGDLMAVVVPPEGDPVALNASGRAGSGADPGRLRSEGHREMPFRGDVRSATVPGCVDGWVSLHDRFGRLSLDQVLAPALSYAKEGFPASPTLAVAAVQVGHLPEAVEISGVRRAGQLLRRPGSARALAAIAREGRRGFYLGEFGDALLTLGAGEFSTGDLEQPSAAWVAALSVEAMGLRLWTVPPNSQGYLTLASAWIASGLDLPLDAGDPLWAHLLIEASRQAAFDRPEVLSEEAETFHLLDVEELARRRDRISPQARVALKERYGRGDTIALCAVDSDRMGVSILQSNASGFGSHLIVPGVRIFLHNRGIGFSLEPGHDAEYRPGARPPHTLSPLAVTHQGKLRAVAGSMGGDGQPQFLLQVLTRWTACGQPAGEAVSAGRWVLSGGSTGFDTWRGRGDEVTVLVEGHAPAAWVPGLKALGHRVERAPAFDHGFGHAHLISVDDDHLAAGSDPRPRSGAAVGY